MGHQTPSGSTKHFVCLSVKTGNVHPFVTDRQTRYFFNYINNAVIEANVIFIKKDNCESSSRQPQQNMERRRWLLVETKGNQEGSLPQVEGKERTHSLPRSPVEKKALNIESSFS